ncbi:MAG: hypothetical protein ACOVOR_03525 [Rhabdochlamydiaceae bacterium]
MVNALEKTVANAALHEVKVFALKTCCQIVSSLASRVINRVQEDLKKHEEACQHDHIKRIHLASHFNLTHFNHSSHFYIGA